MKAFKNALKSFNRKSTMRVMLVRGQVYREVFAKDIEALEGKAGLVRRRVYGEKVPVFEQIYEPGIAASIKESRDVEPRSFNISDLLKLRRPATIDELLAHEYRHPDHITPGYAKMMLNAGFEFRNGVFVAEDSGCHCKERSNELGLPGLQCIMCGTSEARQAMFSGTGHVKGIFCQGETARRILTGMEVDLGKSDLVTEDPSLQPLADSLRTGRYTPSFDGAKDEPRYDHRKTLLALTSLANLLHVGVSFSFRLVYPESKDSKDFGIAVMMFGCAATQHKDLDLNAIAVEIRNVDHVSTQLVPAGVIAFAAALTHTLDSRTDLFQFSLVEEVGNKARQDEVDAKLEKFKKSFQNILTLLGYGEEVRFEVVAKPQLSLGGYRVKVEFICDEPPLKMYEAINPAIFEHAWIDCNEIERIEQKLINKKEEAELAECKHKPIATRLVDAYEAEVGTVQEGFLNLFAKVSELRPTLTPRLIAEATWAHIPNIVPKALMIVLTGGFANSAIIGKLTFVSHETPLALKHRESDGIIMEIPLPYEAAYMMFAKEILEEILNTPHFPFAVKWFVQYSHPLSHSNNVIETVAPIIDKILKKRGPVHVADKELYDIIKVAVSR